MGEEQGRESPEWVVRSIRVGWLVGWYVGRFSCASTQNGEGVLIVCPLIAVESHRKHHELRGCRLVSA